MDPITVLLILLPLAAFGIGGVARWRGDITLAKSMTWTGVGLAGLFLLHWGLEPLQWLWWWIKYYTPEEWRKGPALAIGFIALLALVAIWAKEPIKRRYTAFRTAGGGGAASTTTTEWKRFIPSLLMLGLLVMYMNGLLPHWNQVSNWVWGDPIQFALLGGSVIALCHFFGGKAALTPALGVVGGIAFVLFVIVPVWSGIRADFIQWQQAAHESEAATRARMNAAPLDVACAPFKDWERQTCHLRSTRSGQTIFWAEGTSHVTAWRLCVAQLPRSDDDYVLWYKDQAGHQRRWHAGVEGMTALGFEIKNGGERDITYWQAPRRADCKT